MRAKGRQKLSDRETETARWSAREGARGERAKSRSERERVREQKVRARSE